MYSVNYHTLRFTDDYCTLLVVDSDDEVIADFDLTTSTPYFEVKVTSGEYVIAGTTCTTCEEVFAIDVESNAGSATVVGTTIEGLGIIDLRDTGRFGSSVTFNLTACPVIIHRQTGAYALRFRSSADSPCFS